MACVFFVLILVLVLGGVLWQLRLVSLGWRLEQHSFVSAYI